MKVATFSLLFAASMAAADDWHVAQTGNNENPGTAAAPFRSIQKAADLAQPGDTITVHEGIYRERINPPRGGISDDKRIVYQAAPGEKVEIRGSEVVKGWVKAGKDTWKVVLPNSFFGAFNPFAELVKGDWFKPKGRDHHTGAVYLNGEWLIEAAKLEDLEGESEKPLWFAKVDEKNTILWAQFPGVDPNTELVEVNARRAVFYPDKPGRNYITVRGFILRQAATNWAPPTAEQVGLIGTHWSKGWIIENNVVSHSVCSGIALGKYGDEFDNKGQSAEGYVGTIKRALTFSIPWDKEHIGSHIVRNNTISNCEQAGIVGSMGAAFSKVTGNTIHDIWVRQLWAGAEQAGIKFHGAIDVEISRNHVYRTSGIWLDWMAQGTRISGNLLHDNVYQDLFMEVDHGPYLVDNNLFLSQRSLWDASEGGAYVHNLFAGFILSNSDPRETPYHPAHSTAIAGLKSIQGGDNKFYNNIFVGNGGTPKASAMKTDPKRSHAGYGLWVYDQRELPSMTGGNVYFRGARPYTKETDVLVLDDFKPALELQEQADGVQVQLSLPEQLGKVATKLVTTGLLGKAVVPQAAYENPDGSPLSIAQDFLGKPRNPEKPTPGPFEAPGNGRVTLKLWPPVR